MNNDNLEMFYDKASGGVVFFPRQKSKPATNGSKDNVIDLSKNAKTEKQS